MSNSPRMDRVLRKMYSPIDPWCFTSISDTLTRLGLILIAMTSMAHAQAIGTSVAEQEPIKTRAMQLNNADQSLIGTIDVTPPDVTALKAEDKVDGGPTREGVTIKFDARHSVRGPWIPVRDGGHVWIQSVHAEGAIQMALRIDPVHITRGSQITVYDPNEPDRPWSWDATSHYKGKKYLWSRIISGDELLLEYYLPPGTDPSDPSANITLSNIVYIYNSPSIGTKGHIFGCHEDISCHPPWKQNEGKAVARIRYTEVATGDVKACTGALLNRTSNDQTNIFMTAWHCRIDFEEFLQFVWEFETDVCNGSVSTGLTTEDAVSLATNSTNDWQLIGLVRPPRGPPTYLNWSNSTNSLPNGTAVYGIHHPGGHYKRWSQGIKQDNNGQLIDASDTLNLICLPGQNVHQIDWSLGLVEGGSSGSPIMDDNGTVHGVLSCKYTLGCTVGEFEGNYGKLSLAYDSLAPFLDPQDSVYVDPSYSGVERGTVSQPFNGLDKAIFAVPQSNKIILEGNNYGVYVFEKGIYTGKGFVLKSRNGSSTFGN